MQVAQAALAVLDVGLDQVAALAGPPVPLLAFGHLGVYELAAGPGHHFGLEPAIKLGKQLRVAADQAYVEKRGADREIRPRQLEALLDGPRCVPDLQAEVPENNQDVLVDALAPRGLLVGAQEKQVDVRAGSEHAASVASGRNNGHALGVRRIACAVDVADGVTVEQSNQFVLEQRQARRATSPIAVGLELGTRGGAHRAEQHLQPVKHRCPAGSGIATPVQLAQLVPQLGCVKVRGSRSRLDIHASLGPARAKLGPARILNGFVGTPRIPIQLPILVAPAHRLELIEGVECCAGRERIGIDVVERSRKLRRPSRLTPGAVHPGGRKQGQVVERRASDGRASFRLLELRQHLARPFDHSRG